MIRDLLQESYNAMLHNRRRTALTMLGMAWGIATVVMLLAYGDGFGRAIVNIFAEFGTKLFIVFPGRSTMQAGGQKAGAQIRLTLDDVDLLSANIPQITHITPSCDKDAIMQFDNDAGHALLPEGHEHAPADHRLHAGRNGISERHVERHGQGDVGEEGHLLED